MNEMDGKIADQIVELRLTLKNLKTYSGEEVRNVKTDEELGVDEDDGGE